MKKLLFFMLLALVLSLSVDAYGGGMRGTRYRHYNAAYYSYDNYYPMHYGYRNRDPYYFMRYPLWQEWRGLW